MLSYRHAFHAGNHADILKHLCLYLVQSYFNQKDKPYWYIDTHAGIGLYQLDSKESTKVNEHLGGISILRQQQNLPTILQDFIQSIDENLPEPSNQYYAGSPFIAANLIREQDKMRLYELHPQDVGFLENNIHERKMNKQTTINNQDGFKGLISLLPPPTRRAIVLIDPPYEVKTDYQQVIKTLQDALKRFNTGCYMIWFPVLTREESQNFPQALQKLGIDNYLHVQLHVHAPRADGFGMHGSGMWIINPPYNLPEQLESVLPTICQLLKQDNTAHFKLHYNIR